MPFMIRPDTEELLAEMFAIQMQMLNVLSQLG